MKQEYEAFSKRLRSGPRAPSVERRIWRKKQRFEGWRKCFEVWAGILRRERMDMKGVVGVLRGKTKFTRLIKLNETQANKCRLSYLLHPRNRS